jgi:hypothetical protein
MSGIRSLQQAGRGGDTHLAHLRTGELVLPPEILDKRLISSLEKKLNDNGFQYSELVVGDEDVSINPATGLPEFGLFSKLKKAVSKAWKGVKKVIDPIAKVAQFVPGPWQPYATIYNKGKAAINIAKGEAGAGDYLTLMAGSTGGNTGGGKFFDSFSKVKEAGFEGLKSLPGQLFQGAKSFLESPIEGIRTLGSNVMTSFGMGTPSPEAQQAQNFLNNMSPEELAQYKATNPEGYAKVLEKAAGQSFNLFSGDPGYDPTTGKGQSRIGMIEDFLKSAGKGAGKLRSGIEGLTGIDPAFALLAKRYGELAEKAAEKEQYGMGDIREMRPDLVPPVYQGGLGGFNLGFAEGGEVLDMRDGGESAGPGTGTSDDIPAMLSDGEFVMTAKAVRNAGAFDVQEGAGGIMQLAPSGNPSREKGSDNMMTLMKYLEGVA